IRRRCRRGCELLRRSRCAATDVLGAPGLVSHLLQAETAGRLDGPHVEHADVAADVRSPDVMKHKEHIDMRMRFSVVLLLAASAVTSLSAHVIVSPLQSKPGVVQKYELRIHNEAKVAATSIDLDIPEGVTVTEVAKTALGTYTTKTMGDRITAITWEVDVQPNKYVALPFTAKNPVDATELHWSTREHLADGSTVDWSDKPGPSQKGSVTKLGS